jgi:pilus assembly protein CpaD
MTARTLIRQILVPSLLLALVACTQPTTMDSSSPVPRPVLTQHAKHFTVTPVRAQGGTAAVRPRSLDDIVAFVRVLQTPSRITISGQDAAVTAAMRRSLLERLGGSSVIVSAGPLPPGADRNATTITVSWATVSVPGCPDWTRRDGPSASRLHSSNFGCATAHTLAAMVDQPVDLSAPVPLGPADGTREALAIDRYRTDKVKDPSSTGGFAP